MTICIAALNPLQTLAASKTAAETESYVSTDTAGIEDDTEDDVSSSGDASDTGSFISTGTMAMGVTFGAIAGLLIGLFFGLTCRRKREE